MGVQSLADPDQLAAYPRPYRTHEADDDNKGNSRKTGSIRPIPEAEGKFNMDRSH